MPKEIEIKIKVENHDAILTKLKSVNAEQVTRLFETNIFVDTSKGKLAGRDSGVRLRSELNESTGEARVVWTFKGPREESAMKIREEIEVEVSDLDSALEILAKIGLRERLRFEKRRERWRLNDCLIELDELPTLGYFVEIEGPTEQAILATQKELGLDESTIEPRGYAAMVAKHLAKGGREESALGFTDAPPST